MTRVLLDTNVFIHAVGGDPALRPACQRVIAHLTGGRLTGEASSLLIEEIVHVRHRRGGDRALAVSDGRAAAALLVLHPVGEEEVETALEVIARRHGLTVILSTDRGFDGSRACAASTRRTRPQCRHWSRTETGPITRSGQPANLIRKRASAGFASTPRTVY